MTFLVEPVGLAGEYVRVEPLSQEHANGLFNRGRSEADWDPGSSWRQPPYER